MLTTLPPAGSCAQLRDCMQTRRGRMLAIEVAESSAAALRSLTLITGNAGRFDAVRGVACGKTRAWNVFGAVLGAAYRKRGVETC
jgi:hypothetical protein